jgi:acetoin utilization protein AcuB
MPIPLAVNGIPEILPIQPPLPRVIRGEPADPQGGKSAHRQAVVAAETAYRQQTGLPEGPKPAVLARDLMTTPVFALSSDCMLTEAWTLMQKEGFRHIPVTSVHGTLVGILSDRDLLHHVPELITRADLSQATRRRLADIMTSRVISATPTTDIRDIARVMLNAHIHAVPILNSDRKPIGILTSRDLLRGIAQHGPLELWT